MQGVGFTMQGECRHHVACQKFSKISALLHLQYNATAALTFENVCPIADSDWLIFLNVSAVVAFV
jgi:hypothetical protein